MNDVGGVVYTAMGVGLAKEEEQEEKRREGGEGRQEVSVA